VQLFHAVVDGRYINIRYTMMVLIASCSITDIIVQYTLIIFDLYRPRDERHPHSFIIAVLCEIIEVIITFCPTRCTMQEPIRICNI
jgi:hypothetical protein